MLPKKYRLKNKKAFDATYKNRCIVSDSLLTMYLGKQKKEPQGDSYPTKIGFVVSKKFHKRATKRNRIKRLMREACRLAIKENRLSTLSEKMSVIILPKANALNADFKTVEKSFKNLLERIK